MEVAHRRRPRAEVLARARRCRRQPAADLATGVRTATVEFIQQQQQLSAIVRCRSQAAAAAGLPRVPLRLTRRARPGGQLCKAKDCKSEHFSLDSLFQKLRQFFSQPNPLGDSSFSSSNAQDMDMDGSF